MDYCVHIISRQKAKELGMCRYFTGEPCNHGHVCERTVSKCTCVMCASLYNKGYHAEYYAGNKEKIKDRVKSGEENTHKIAKGMRKIGTKKIQTI